MKILIVFGTRPEAIKMAPLVHAFKANPRFETIVCVTAQHRQMLDQVLNIFDIRPDIDLNLMKAGQDLYDVTSLVLLGMRDVLKTHQPDAVLVHGDTTTAYATAMAAFYAGIPVGHIEAGLRTHDIRSPFPEEFNRQVVTKVSHWHFAPTESSKQNLLDEGVAANTITVTGNTVIDALFWVLKRIDSEPVRRNQITSFLNDRLPFVWQSQKFVLITGHRRENFGAGFLEICEAIKQLAIKYPKVHFVYPVHLNPNVQKPVFELIDGISNIHLIDPLEYEPFVYLLKHAYLVLTDSGGIQEEAPSLGKPVLVMRGVTERPEAVQAGTVRLVGADTDKITRNVSELLDNEQSYLMMSKAHNPYGDGISSERIVGVFGE
ncbi:UDP-N-acetylglucosamine 2-epimerase (non-hydrolyzing) [Orrella sp. NBD-18]|uniref:Probable UDP-N-acetylglucosamine 2-epimerase n=1 Tax=Sheuella amnicola TaxID=2707330 RepID=A0A6B2R831_9BURK|nr:UDP-N-acetylglucosamine 2-epimerase (non-hydrolyzing) [Sheuella amnicola]NDY83455.1 UDP-N-acetylglucosamine 2-epimerase (non-hydrolyzing) [Sheuella amnicola]